MGTTYVSDLPSTANAALTAKSVPSGEKPWLLLQPTTGLNRARLPAADIYSLNLRVAVKISVFPSGLQFGDSMKSSETYVARASVDATATVSRVSTASATPPVDVR